MVSNPFDLNSHNGVLNTALTLRSEKLVYLEECFIYQDTSGVVEAPTLRVSPGDRVVLALTNRLLYTPPASLQRPSAAIPASKMAGMQSRNSANDPCSGGTMAATSTNIHFHGLNIPPVFHQDEVLNTAIQNTELSASNMTFEFLLAKPQACIGITRIFMDLRTLQVNGGASGALIVNGMEKVKPQVGGLPERVLIIRQQFSDPNSWLAGPYQLTPEDFLQPSREAELTGN